MKPAHFYIGIALVLIFQAGLFYFLRSEQNHDIDRVERAINRSYKRQQEVDSLLTVAGSAKQEINNIENKKTENYNTYVQQYHEAISADSSTTYRLYLRNIAEIDSAFRSGYFTPSNP